jgi:ABC-type multidrug transport system fused ATPase/permease subunit
VLLQARPGDETIVPAAPTLPITEIVRRFWPYARVYRPWLLLGLVFVVLVPVVEAAQIWMFKRVVDDVLVPRDFGPFFWIALVYFGLTVLAGAVSFADELLATWVGERFLLGLRTDVFRHLQTLSLDFFERRRLGDVLSRLTGDIAAIEAFVLSGVASALSAVVQIGVFVALLFYLQWQLALVSLVVAPLFWVTARRFSRLLKRASREKRRRGGSLTAVAEESLANAPLVQAYGREEREVERFRRENLGQYAAQMASTRLKALFSPLVDLIELGGALVVLGFGTWLLARGELTLGGLLVFVAYLGRLYSPIRSLARLTNTIYAASAGAERVVELLDERPSVRERPRALALRRARGRIAFENVSFRYPGSATDAVAHVSFTLEPGQTLALVGLSGAGKSTLAKLLLRFYDPDAGRILLDGHDLRDLRLASVRANVALLLQDSLVFDDTVRENIAYGRPDADECAIVAAAREADADEFVASLPEGYGTRVGQRGRRLSGGQRQRIAIARALLRDAPVLVLDEPTAGLDVESSERILGPLRALMNGRTTIVISHSLLTVREAGAILVLDDGRVAEHGTHSQLLGGDGLYSRLYRVHEHEALTVS